MRLRHPDGTVVHLSYCTNVHPAEDLAGVLAQLADFAEPVRERLGAPRLGLGLWLARTVATRLLEDPGALPLLRDELERRGLEVVTLNAFPYAGFHTGAPVKKAVYHPDWTERERLAYTLDCARILTRLLPSDAVRGSISSLPLAWRTPWSPYRAARAYRQLGLLADGLSAVRAETGRTIRVGLEPEPGCVMGNVAAAISLWDHVPSDLIGLCLDACHLATEFEDPAEVCGALVAHGVPVVKAQASCALHVDSPTTPAARVALGRFAEERFLHQARERAGGDHVLRADDLPDALAGALPGDGPWRVHYHVPVHTALTPPLRSTQSELLATLDALLGGPAALTDHVDIETYTWSVLPETPTRSELLDGIAAELAWTRDALFSLGMKEIIS
ncbi:metabolite traffic protein EboE [Streptomyces sp. NPDC004838]